MNLTDEELRKFADYCKETARENLGLAEQMEKLGTPMVEVLAKKYRVEAQAFAIVAGILERMEPQELR